MERSSHIKDHGKSFVLLNVVGRVGIKIILEIIKTRLNSTSPGPPEMGPFEVGHGGWEVEDNKEM